MANILRKFLSPPSTRSKVIALQAQVGKKDGQIAILQDKNNKLTTQLTEDEKKLDALVKINQEKLKTENYDHAKNRWPTATIIKYKRLVKKSQEKINANKMKIVELQKEITTLSGQLAQGIFSQLNLLKKQLKNIGNNNLTQWADKYLDGGTIQRMSSLTVNRDVTTALNFFSRPNDRKITKGRAERIVQRDLSIIRSANKTLTEYHQKLEELIEKSNTKLIQTKIALNSTQNMITELAFFGHEIASTPATSPTRVRQGSRNQTDAQMPGISLRTSSPARKRPRLQRRRK